MLDKKVNKGITLIALVITIIVMLILVAVTITMAVNGGLFEYAGDAATQTNEAIEKEQTLVSGGVNIAGTWYNSIDEYVNGPEDNGTYDETEKDAKGLLTKNATYKSNGYTAVIPEGFKIIGGLNGKTTIGNGLVIQDADGNEFVWIPVEKAIITEKEIAKLKAENSNLTTDLLAVQSLVDRGIYPMAIEVNTKDESGNITETNYEGLLYSFSGTDILTVTVNDWTKEWNVQEPATVSKDAEKLDACFGEGYYTDALFQNSYNSMIRSVAENGGFYVGRFEMCVGSNDYARCSKGLTVSLSGTWDSIYYKAMKFSEYSGADEVTSNLIWKSQWDQMMLFVNGMPGGANGDYTYNINIKGQLYEQADGSLLSGSDVSNQVANIFDLKGGYAEYTMGTCPQNERRAICGIVQEWDEDENGTVIYENASRYYLRSPYEPFDGYTGRITLYIS